MAGPVQRAGWLLLAVAVIAYPVAVYFLLDLVGPVALGLLLILLLLPRIVLIAGRRALWLVCGAAICALFAVFLTVADSELVLKLYPTFVNLGLLAAYGYTLIHPPSMIERLTRHFNVRMTRRGVAYTRGVTMLWCAFFVINAGVATFIAFTGTMEAWTFYNGFLAYVLIATLFVIEFGFRQIYKRIVPESGRVG
jgi:uncharacterized membrane protein